MRKIISKHLLCYMTVAIIVICVCIFAMQTVRNQTDNTADSYEKLALVKETLASNDEQIEQLKGSLGDNALAKARAFAYMLEQDPTIKDNDAKMQEICTLLAVDELHVIDEKGIITHSTVAAYVGFDMTQGEQTKPFLQIIEDPTYELAQEPQPNAAQGILFQYVGVGRLDDAGLVQIGLRPEVLENMLAGTATDVVLAGYDFGSDGYIFAIDLADNTILAHKNESLIGSDATEAGFPAGMIAGEGEATVDGTKGYYVAEEYNGMLIGTMLPASEYYEVRKNQTIVVSASMLVIFIVLLVMINRLINNKIVSGVQRIIGGLENITQGNLDRKIEENDNPEFQSLSESINKMVDSIKESMERNQLLLEKQQEDMKKNQLLIQEVKNVCRGIEQVSRNTRDNSKTIYNGTEEQKSEVDRLNDTMEQLSSRLRESAQTSKEVATVTGNAVEKMMSSRKDMESLLQCIQEAADTAGKIVSIIDEIESIATQTNMLSLNASIESARAGEMGRGFAVVAGQVGELADRSAKAAQQSAALIMNTIQVVNQGKDMVGNVADEFMGVAEEIERSNQNIEDIATMAEEQVNAVLDVVEGLQRIAGVVENNVIASREGKTTSEDLAKESTKLYEIVESN